MKNQTPPSPDSANRLTALMTVLEWTLILILAYLQWAGDSAPPHVVEIATIGWIVVALVCVVLLAVSALHDGGRQDNRADSARPNLL